MHWFLLLRQRTLSFTCTFLSEAYFNSRKDDTKYTNRCIPWQKTVWPWLTLTPTEMSVDVTTSPIAKLRRMKPARLVAWQISNRLWGDTSAQRQSVRLWGPGFETRMSQLGFSLVKKIYQHCYVIIGPSPHHFSPTGRAPFHSILKTNTWCFFN